MATKNTQWQTLATPPLCPPNAPPRAGAALAQYVAFFAGTGCTQAVVSKAYGHAKYAPNGNWACRAAAYANAVLANGGTLPPYMAKAHGYSAGTKGAFVAQGISNPKHGVTKGAPLLLAARIAYVPNNT